MRGHENVLKRLLVHASAFNLGLWMRSLFGMGTPRALQGRTVAVGAVLSTLWSVVDGAITRMWDPTVSANRPRRSADDLIACA